MTQDILLEADGFSRDLEYTVVDQLPHTLAEQGN